MNQNIRFQRAIVVVGIALFVIKLLAWYITDSISIYTDALESTVNVLSAIIGLYSLSLAAKPRDHDHPYGHGKVEFISAAIEGSMIFVAGILIIFEAINSLKHDYQIAQLDYGIGLVAVTAVANYVMGAIAIRQGKKSNSLALTASGEHLQTDTYSTAGIILGLILIYFTKLQWIDSAVAIIFAGFILKTGYQIVRKSLAGMMDEADEELLQEVVGLLERRRADNWIDIHNLRVIKYGSTLHFDCHLTVPWFFNVHEAHEEVDRFSGLVRDNFGDSVELFIHTDGCKEFSCRLCSKEGCPMRKSPFERKIHWDVGNISTNKRHQLEA
jgi:cation diffusion facilitator family transporter